ncbi:hypothetical protein Tco_0995964, partial [Tanacetum coccineum]
LEVVEKILEEETPLGESDVDEVGNLGNRFRSVDGRFSINPLTLLLYYASDPLHMHWSLEPWQELSSVDKIKVIKEESEALGLLIIDDDLFTCDTPLGVIFNKLNRLSGMDDDLFTNDVKIPELSYSLSVEQQMDNLYNGNLDVYERKLCYNECEKMYAEAVIFINKRLVRLIDVTVEQRLDLKCGDHTMVYEIEDLKVRL